MNIILFFTYDISLKNWEKSGLLSREILFYEKLNNDYGLTFTFITYGDLTDVSIVADKDFIKVIPVYSLIKHSENRLIRFLKSFVIPFKIKKYIISSSLIKTNQLHGSWVPIISKILYKKPLLLRTGYDLLTFSKKNNKHPSKIFFYYLLTKLSLFFSDIYLVSSNSDKFSLSNSFKTSGKIKVRPNWVVNNNVTKYEDRFSDRIISVGRLEHQKNYSKLISFFGNKNFEIDIYGNGSLKSNLIEEAKKKNTILNIHDPLPNVEILKILRNYKFFVTTSLFEGNPKVILEAMAAGCVVISLKNENIQEIITDDFNGIIINENSDLNSLINDLHEKDWQRLSVNARSYIFENHSIERIVYEEYKDYELLANPNNS